ncbi:MAG: GNAT family N-acetyltransferase [Aggregatilineales bacterium]
MNDPQLPEGVAVRPIQESDAPAFRTLRLEALKAHPDAFGADYAESEARPLEHWQERARPDPNGMQITFVAESDDSLIGMAGIYRNSSLKSRHSSSVWGVYVRETWRGRRIADALVTTCVNWAQAQQDIRIVKLCVVTTNIPAIHCYVRCGFAMYGIEPEAIAWNGVYYDELLMMLRIANQAVTKA